MITQVLATANSEVEFYGDLYGHVLGQHFEPGEIVFNEEQKQLHFPSVYVMEHTLIKKLSWFRKQYREILGVDGLLVHHVEWYRIEGSDPPAGAEFGDIDYDEEKGIITFFPGKKMQLTVKVSSFKCEFVQTDEIYSEKTYVEWG